MRNNRIRKVLSLIICIGFIFQQAGFAQVDISGFFRQIPLQQTDKFRPVHLRYYSYEPQLDSVKVLVDKGDYFKGLSPPSVFQANKGTVPGIEHETKKLMEYFYIGLSLPNTSFWVNLRPEEKRGQASFLHKGNAGEKKPVPFFKDAHFAGVDVASVADIIDPLLAQTDMGRIFLEADVQLKKDTARFTSPQTPQGKEYWNKLYRKAEEIFGTEHITIPTLTRPWIVPGEVIVRYNKDSVYIYKANLKVMLEEDYQEKRGQASFLQKGNAGEKKPVPFFDPRFKQLNVYSSKLIRQLIIPQLTKEINTARRYAELRQVFYSLILAQWFKARYRSLSSQLTVDSSQKKEIINLIDSKSLNNLTSKEPWQVETYYQQYQKSFKDGEYNVKETVRGLSGQNIRSYFSGGLAINMGGTEVKVTAIPEPGAIEPSSLIDPNEAGSPDGLLPYDPRMERSNSTSESPLRQFANVGKNGEKIWVDGLTLQMLEPGGEFESLVRDHGISGVTTNLSLLKTYLKDPGVLKKAEKLARQGKSSAEIYYELVKDLAITVIGIFKKYNVDGKFSVELDPTKADDVQASVEEAMKWTDIDPAYMMVKVAANEAGYQIIEDVTARGRNVNATLIFSPGQYRKVAQAYIRGLGRALESGLDISEVYSVASFFVSRWDVRFAERIPARFHGMFANAVAISAYNDVFLRLFGSQEFKSLQKRGARIQGFLLASTGSKADKMPAEFRERYPQDVYVKPAMGSDVVNTLPVGTIEYLKGQEITFEETIVNNAALAKEILTAMQNLGVDIEAEGMQLFKEGAEAFVKDFMEIQKILSEIVAEFSGNTSSEGADSRGYDGLPNDDYTPEIKRKLDNGEFVACKRVGAAGFLQSIFHSNSFPYRIFPPQTGKIGATQKIALRQEHIDRFNKVITDMGFENQLKDTVIIFIDGQRAHYSVGRNQIYLDTALLDNPAQLRQKLYHEVTERRDILRGLGVKPELMQELERTKFTPEKRTPELKAEIERLAKESHAALKASPIVLRGGQQEKWWEDTRRQSDAGVPWGEDTIVPVSDPGVVKVTLTREMIADYDAQTNPAGRGVGKSFAREEKLGPLAIAGIRAPQDIFNPDNTLMIKNSVERMLTGVSLALMIKILYNQGAGFPYQANYGHEVRYNSDVYQAVMSRTLAAMGFVVHVVPDNQATAIWNTSTMGKFFSFVLSFCGTSSHSQSDIDGLKIMDYEGSQFVIKPILAMLAIKKALIKEIKQAGQVTFYLSEEGDPRITDQLYRVTHNGMAVYREYQEAAAADEYTLGLVKNLAGEGVHIDCAHGAGYSTLLQFFDEMGLSDLKDAVNWMHADERPDFGNLGKSLEDPAQEGKEGIFDLGVDVTQVMVRAQGDRKVNYFPVLATGDYPQRFSELPVGDIILHTDMDNDRLAVSQVLSNNAQTRERLNKIGVVYNVINSEKLLAVFIPNKFFHMLHEMNFRRIDQLIKEGRVPRDRKLAVLTTLASTQAVSEWAAARKAEGYDIAVVNTAVGFAKLANVMYRTEGMRRVNPGQDVVITDARGVNINLGANPLLIAAWEESGGIITGLTFPFQDLMGRAFLAEREKSATESIFLALGLISQMQKGEVFGYKGPVDLAQYLEYLYERDRIATPIDIRYDNNLMINAPSSELDARIAFEAAGNQRKNRVFGAYLALAINYMNKLKESNNDPEVRGQLLEQAKTIIKDMFAQEYAARSTSGDPNIKVQPVLLRNFQEAELVDTLTDIWFTGDGVMFIFGEDETRSCILFRPSGTEPKLKAYGFGKDMSALETNAWAFAFCENNAGRLPVSFTSDPALMTLWGTDGNPVVDKASRMQSTWEQYGKVVDPQELTPGELEKLKEGDLSKLRSFSPPSNQLELMNQWLTEQGLGPVSVDLSRPQAMPQSEIFALLEAIPDEVYADLGRTKEEVLSKERSTEMASVDSDLIPLSQIEGRLEDEKFEERLTGMYGRSKEKAQAEESKLPTETTKMSTVGFDGQENRLGWTTAHLDWILANRERVDSVLKDAQDIRADFRYVIFCGMGGSGLSVQVVKSAFEKPDAETKIYSLRTTDPQAIKEILDELMGRELRRLEQMADDKFKSLNDKQRRILLRSVLENTLVIPVSKSGTTQETVSHKEYFEGLFKQFSMEPEKHLWVITDKGSPMDTRKFPQRNIQLNGRGDIGGRFTSPTTNIFLLPLAIVSPESVWPILERAKAMNGAPTVEEDVFLKLGAFLYHQATQEREARGRDKVTLFVPEELRDLPLWAEQLVEESLGKEGKGISLFYGEPLTSIGLKPVNENDRVFVRINIAGRKTNEAFWEYLKAYGYPVYEIDVADTNSIGGLMLGLQRAVASIGYLWGICFVDQPAVEGYKKATREVMGRIGPGQQVTVPANWRFASNDTQNLRVYYSLLIEAGILTEQELNAEVTRLGYDMSDGPAVYAAILRILARNGGVEAAEITSYGRMTPGLRRHLIGMRQRIYTLGLKMPAKLGEGPDKNHSYHQNIAAGKNMWFSTYFMAGKLQHPQARQYDDNLLKAQTIGTVQSLVDDRRRVVLITSNGSAEDAERDIRDFFIEAARIFESGYPAPVTSNPARVSEDDMAGSPDGLHEYDPSAGTRSTIVESTDVTDRIRDILDGAPSFTGEVIISLSDEELEDLAKKHTSVQFSVGGNFGYGFSTNNLRHSKESVFEELNLLMSLLPPNTRVRISDKIDVSRDTFTFELKLLSSPAGAQSAPEDTGGIDLTRINIVAQAEIRAMMNAFKMPSLDVLEKINVRQEGAQLNNLLNAGIVPAIDRAITYVAASLKEGMPQEAKEAARVFVADYFKLREQEVLDTPNELKAFMFAMAGYR